MTIEDFWALIDACRDVCRERSHTPEAIAQCLTERLGARSAEQISTFLEHQAELWEKSCTWSLWGAAYLINGGCSEDGFDYFRGWLLCQGAEVWQSALQDPDSLAELIDEEQEGEAECECECEQMVHAAVTAYELVTGSVPDRPLTRPPAHLGEAWDFDDDSEMARRYPRIWTKLNASVRSLYDKALSLQQDSNSNLEEAAHLYAQVLEKDPDHIKALNNLSIIQLAKLDFESALQNADKINHLDPSYCEAWITKGSSLFSMGKKQEALQAYEEFVRLRPESHRGYQGLGLVYNALGKHDEALTKYEKCLQLKPEAAHILSDIACCYINMKQFDLAAEYADRCIERCPDYYHPYYAKACICALKNEPAEAANFIKKVLELDPMQRESLRSDPDLDPIREDERIQRLLCDDKDKEDEPPRAST